MTSPAPSPARLLRVRLLLALAFAAWLIHSVLVPKVLGPIGVSLLPGSIVTGLVVVGCAIYLAKHRSGGDSQPSQTLDRDDDLT